MSQGHAFQKRVPDLWEIFSHRYGKMRTSENPRNDIIGTAKGTINFYGQWRSKLLMKIDFILIKAIQSWANPKDIGKRWLIYSYANMNVYFNLPETESHCHTNSNISSETAVFPRHFEIFFQHLPKHFVFLQD